MFEEGFRCDECSFDVGFLWGSRSAFKLHDGVYLGTDTDGQGSSSFTNLCFPPRFQIRVDNCVQPDESSGVVDEYMWYAELVHCLLKSSVHADFICHVYGNRQNLCFWVYLIDESLCLGETLC